MKMTVLYLKDTGQVMAAVTRAAPAAGAQAPLDPGAVDPEVTALAGEALPVRGFVVPLANDPNTLPFSIPAERLGALTVDPDEDQLLAPRRYAVTDDQKLAAQSGVFPPMPQVVAGDPSTVSVTLDAGVTADLPVTLLLEPVLDAAGPGRLLHDVFKPNSTTSQKITFSVHPALSGTYDVLMLLKGYTPVVRSVTFEVIN